MNRRRSIFAVLGVTLLIIAGFLAIYLPTQSQDTNYSGVASCTYSGSYHLIGESISDYGEPLLTAVTLTGSSIGIKVTWRFTEQVHREVGPDVNGIRLSVYIDKHRDTVANVNAKWVELGIGYGNGRWDAGLVEYPGGVRMLVVPPVFSGARVSVVFPRSVLHAADIPSEFTWTALLSVSDGSGSNLGGEAQLACPNPSLGWPAGSPAWSSRDEISFPRAPKT